MVLGADQPTWMIMNMPKLMVYSQMITTCFKKKISTSPIARGRLEYLGKSTGICFSTEQDEEEKNE